MSGAVAEADGEAIDAPAPTIAGLFGKLPGHGDFVRRGWSDETVDALDRWLSEAMRSAREKCGENGFADWIRAAPLWRGYVPAGQLGPKALHVAVALSVDGAGRLFPVAAGVTGTADVVWAHAEQAGAELDAAVYEALGGSGDADALVGAISIDTAAARDPAPERSAWWLRPGGAPTLESDTVDPALLIRLWNEGQG